MKLLTPCQEQVAEYNVAAALCLKAARSRRGWEIPLPLGRPWQVPRLSSCPVLARLGGVGSWPSCSTCAHSRFSHPLQSLVKGWQLGHVRRCSRTPNISHVVCYSSPASVITGGQEVLYNILECYIALRVCYMGKTGMVYSMCYTTCAL